MSPGKLFGGVAAWSVRHARPVVALCVVLGLAGAANALRLQTDAGTGTLVDSGSATYRATQSFKRQFGDDAVVILVSGDLPKLLLTKNLAVLLRLEGCLSGNIPKGHKPLPGVCTEIAKQHPARVVYGPATFINEAIVQIDSLLQAQTGGAVATARAAAAQAVAAAARSGQSPAAQRQDAKLAAGAVMQKFRDTLIQTAFRFGITRPPQLNDPQFVSQVVFDTRQRSGTPKARFAYLFPSSRAALISVRLRPDLSDSQRDAAISMFRRATQDPRFKLDGGSYVVSGVPVVVSGLASTLKTGILVLLVAALIVMALTLALTFRPPLRLMPLGVALTSAGITFGVLSLTGGRLTMASIAVLPVLIGLGVDYAIQLQARFNEALTGQVAVEDAARSAAARGGAVVAVALTATAAGFAVLLLSPVPMMRIFGLLLVLGIAIAFVVALSAGLGAISLASGEGPGRRLSLPSQLGGVAQRLGAAREAAAGRLRSAGTSALAVSISSPGRVLAIAATLAVCGWVAGTRTEVVSDIRDLVPGDMRELKDVNKLQGATGVSGELNVMVRAPDLTDPRVIVWMQAFEKRILARHGFGGEFPSCRKAALCPAISLPELFGSDVGQITRARVQALLSAVPPYFEQAVVTRDPITGGVGSTANIEFGIRVMPLADQKRLIDDIRRQIGTPGTGGGPPAGVSATVVGLPVLAAEANSSLAGSRYWLTGAGLLAVALVLLLVYRSLALALRPLIPIVFATGWSALVLEAMDIPLNPMSATLGALVIAIATEFSVLLASRYREERGGGHSVGEALRRTYARTGAAVLASGVTATAGFGALVVSDIRMLRDFGFVTVVDLGVALIGVMLVLPAVLVLAENRQHATALGVAFRHGPLGRAARMGRQGAGEQA